MRILHVISGINPSNGGPPISLHGLAIAQARAGLEVSIAATWTTDPCPDVVAWLESQNIKVTHIGPAKNPISRHPDIAPTLSRLIDQHDIVHVHAMWEEIQHQACKIARQKKKPYLITPHGMLDTWNMANGKWKKRLYLALRMRHNLKHASAMHFTTTIECDAVARLGFNVPTIVEPLGLHQDDFANLPPKGQFIEKHPQLAGKKIIAFLGRLDRGKGVEILLPAIARLNRDDFHLVLIGPDSHSNYRATIEQMIVQFNVQDKVLLTGMLRGIEKLQALVDAWVLCQPSFHENFGMVVVEALATHCPVIISDQVYLHPQISAAGVGAVTQVDADAVAAQLLDWLEHPSKRDICASKARDFALNTFDWKTIATHWVGYYKNLLHSQAAQH